MTRSEINDRIKLLKRTCQIWEGTGGYVITAADGLFLIKEIEVLREANHQLEKENVERFNGFEED